MVDDIENENREEIRALVVGFLQQNLKDGNGCTIQEFDRQFPIVCDEERDWYKRFGKNCSIDVLRMIPDTAQISVRGGNTYVSLNLHSDAVDMHLVDLITNQKASNKKRPSARAKSSFSLNRRYEQRSNSSSYNSHPRLSSKSTQNSSSWKSGSESFKSAPPTPLRKPSSNLYNTTNNYHSRSNTYYSVSSSNGTSWSNNENGNQQYESMKSSTQPASAKNTSYNHSSSSNSSSATKAFPPQTSQPPTKPLQPTKQPLDLKLKPASKNEVKETISEDPSVKLQKDYLRQRLQYLLNKNNLEIKLMDLCIIYKKDFDEKLDPQKYGYKGLVRLLEDPLISPHIQVNFDKAPFVTITHRRDFLKENQAQDVLKERFNAIDLFNLKSMRNCIDSFTELPIVPVAKKIQPIEDIVKLKTLRLFFKAPNSTMNVDDWPDKFELDTKLHLNIEDYGHDTYESFFKELAKDLPLDVKRDAAGTLIGQVYHDLLSDWVKDEMTKGHFKAITAIDKRYESYAFPNDTYDYAKTVTMGEYYPSSISAVKKADEKVSYDEDGLWIMLRNHDAYKDLLTIESTLNCYSDYKMNDMISRFPRVFMIAGSPCAAYDEINKSWYRGIIKKVVSDSEVCVLLVDYGEFRTFENTALFCIMKRHLDKPVSSFWCKLHGIEAFKQIPSHFKLVLQEYTNDHVQLACKFIKQEDLPNKPAYMPSKRWIVDLCDTRNGEDKYLIQYIRNFRLEGNRESVI